MQFTYLDELSKEACVEGQHTELIMADKRWWSNG